MYERDERADGLQPQFIAIDAITAGEGWMMSLASTGMIAGFQTTSPITDAGERPGS